MADNKRHCRRCKAVLGPERYFNCLRCQPELPPSGEFDSIQAPDDAISLTATAKSHKYCPKCKQDRPVTEFGAEPRVNGIGYRDRCRRCDAYRRRPLTSCNPKPDTVELKHEEKV